MAARDIADFILFLNEVFDILNGSSAKSTSPSKPLTSAIHFRRHIKFWNEAIATVQSMEFYDEPKIRWLKVPSIRNFIFKTLKGFKYLTNKLAAKN